MIKEIFNYICNNMLTIVTIIIALIALWQTHKQIKISNKQFLFSKRLDKYLLVRSLIELYKDNITLLNYKDNKDDEAIIVDYQFINLTNINFLKDITCVINEPKNNEYKNNFLIIIEDLKKVSNELKFIFPKCENNYLSDFVNNYQNVLMELYKHQILIDLMTKDEIPRKQKPTFKELQKEYGELSHRKRLYEALDKLENSYNKIIDNNIIKKVEKTIKL